MADDDATILDKQGWLKQEAQRTKIQLRLHDSKGSWLEGVLARGDRSLGNVLESAWRNGARFDSWQEHLNLDAWTRAFAKHDVDPAPYLSTIPIRARLPWDHIDVGLEDGFLEREYRKALKNRLSPPCGKAAGMFVHHTNVRDAVSDARRLVCYDCGIACDMGQMRQERFVRLRSLGAETPAPAEAPPPEPVERTSNKRRPRGPTVEQGPGIKLRLGFQRLGRSAYSSHLDQVRLLPRLFRRAGLPLFYSEGFHPKPVMVFGPPLPLGTASFAEYVDVKLRSNEVTDLTGIVDLLNTTTTLGFSFVGAEVLRPGDPSVSRVIEEVEYVAGLAPDAVQALGGSPRELTMRVAHARQGSLVVRRTVKGLSKNVDVGAYLLDAEVGSGAEWLARAGIGGALTPLRLRLRITPSGTARASEALEALFGTKDLSARFLRTQVWGNAGTVRATPLETAAFRRSQNLPIHASP